MSKISFFLLFFYILLLNLYSHENDGIILKYDEYLIRKVGQITRATDVIGEKTFFETVFDLLTGYEDQYFNKPVSIACAVPGRLFILDQANRCFIFLGVEEKVYKCKEMPELSSLVDVAWLSDSEVIFSESHQNKIYIYNLSSDEIAEFKVDKQLMQPTGIACDQTTGNIWICETALHKISVFSPSGQFIKQMGKRGTGHGEFNFPTFIRFDDHQRFYVVDTMNHRIQVFDHEANLISVIGSAGDGSGNLARPKGLAFDSFGHIYVVDALFHNVQIFDLEGNYLEQFGRQGRGEGEFWMPSGIAIDQDNRIYVADTYNSRIQIFQLEIIE